MNRPQKILLVEDDARLARQVDGQLVEARFHVTWSRNGDEALEQDPEAFDLWILDLMLPKTHGLDVLKRVRRESDVPILVLSAVRDSRTTVRALQLGCDDFLTKPFWPEELLARVQARLRRPTSVRNDRMEWSGLVLDLAAHRVTLGGRDLALTPVEFDIFAALARRPHAAVPRIDLAIEVLDPDREGTDRTLDVHVSRLRKKLGPRSSCIATVWGVGYRFEGGGPP